MKFGGLLLKMNGYFNWSHEWAVEEEGNEKKTDDEIRWKHVPVIVLLINNFIRTTHSPNPTPFYRIENLIVTPLSWIQCQSGVGNGQNRSIFLRRPGEFR